MLDPKKLLETLNPPQQDAVTHGDGPLLILAGAGSGKTRVITSRIAWLISQHGVDPRGIVAVTFTNKAAAEMRERAESALGHDISGAFLGTFHSFGLRILRMHAAEAGYPPSFVIYDTTDQRALVRQISRDLKVDEKEFPARQAIAIISEAKTDLISPSAMLADSHSPAAKTWAEIYREYEKRLKRAGAMDFDDLLVQVIYLFRKHPHIQEKYAQRTQHLLVDEYQDTNPIQYLMIRALAGERRNVCCVGDEDQSIYSFRGADIRNILDFERDYPDARVIKLEQNYRSTSTILAAASAVIRNNMDRHDKKLWTGNPEGEKIALHQARDDREEADLVIADMLHVSRQGHTSLRDMAILYRTNACSRLFEDRLVQKNVPYRVVGSLRFYERREIKDVLAWLRMVVQPHSDQDFLRAASVPPRGLGEKTLASVREIADRNGVSYHEATLDALRHPDALPSRAIKPLTNFIAMIRDLTTFVSSMKTKDALEQIIETIGYERYLEKSFPTDFRSRIENLGALINAAAEHDEKGAPEALAGFLDRVSLRSDTDDVEGEQGPLLMTIHSAKGLEFDHVYIVGFNEGLFPHQLSLSTPEGIEEERRLVYVAITRARRRLVLSMAQLRYNFGNAVRTLPSPFLAEIPAEVLRSTRYAPPTRKSAPTPVSRHRTPAAGTAKRAGELTYVKDAPDYSGEGAPEPGMKVRHPKFGQGLVLNIRGTGAGTTVEIRFKDYGLKRVMPKYVPLLPPE